MSSLDVTQWGMSPPAKDAKAEAQLAEMDRVAKIILDKFLEDLEQAIAVARELRERDMAVVHLATLISLQVRVDGAMHRVADEAKRYLPGMEAKP